MEGERGFWDYRTFCLVTGGSRGIGKTIAVEFARKFKPGSVIHVIARSAGALEEAKKQVLAAAPHVQCVSTCYDFGTPDKDEFSQFIKTALAEVGVTKDFEQALLVHNAGSVGDISRRALQFESVEDLRAHYDENVISPLILSAQFFKIFGAARKRTMIQVTSQASIEAVPNLSIYSSSKAARDMLMRSIAVEEPGITTLSYAPGPVDTPLFKYFATNIGDPGVKARFDTMIKQEQILSPEVTVAKLMEILTAGNFKSGDRNDFFETIV